MNIHVNNTKINKKKKKMPLNQKSQKYYLKKKQGMKSKGQKLYRQSQTLKKIKFRTELKTSLFIYTLLNNQNLIFFLLVLS